ncbi:MAG: hypothetical protein JXJ20_04370 [Anaerolineae bacterium]|nr:hypothetical protein [Anaerolineae bacterium]
MYMYRLEGTYREIGAEYGALLRDNRVSLPHVSQTRLKFARQCERHVQEHIPELLDEIEGMAEGSGYDLERLKMAALAPRARPGCSVVAVAGQHTADGKTLVGRNHDWYPSLLGYVAFCETHPQGAVASLGCNNMLVGRPDGINAAGVAVAITAVEGGRDYPGIMFTLAARAVLDRCHSTEEAVTLLQGIRHARAINFLVADAGGDIAVIEAAPRCVHVMRPKNGFAAVTNQFQSDEMARYEYVRRRPPNSYRRLCILREWFAARQAPVTEQAVQAVLRAPYPRGLCVKPTAGRKGIRTVWSWSAELGTGSLDFAGGSPADVPYRTYALS